MQKPTNQNNFSGGLSITDLLLFPQKWTEYKKKYMKTYLNVDEETERKHIFFRRYSLMQDHNRKYKKAVDHFKIVITPLSDRTEEEIREYNKTQYLDYIISEEYYKKAWLAFKTKMKKVFKTEEEEETAKVLYLTRLARVNKLRNELKKKGLDFDTKDIDRYCDLCDSVTRNYDIDEGQTSKQEYLEKLKRKTLKKPWFFEQKEETKKNV